MSNVMEDLGDHRHRRTEKGSEDSERLGGLWRAQYNRDVRKAAPCSEEMMEEGDQRYSLLCTRCQHNGWKNQVVAQPVLGTTEEGLPLLPVPIARKTRLSGLFWPSCNCGFPTISFKPSTIALTSVQFTVDDKPFPQTWSITTGGKCGARLKARVLRFAWQQLIQSLRAPPCPLLFRYLA